MITVRPQELTCWVFKSSYMAKLSCFFPDCHTNSQYHLSGMLKKNTELRTLLCALQIEINRMN